MNSVISIIFVFFLWWSLTGLILYVAKKGDLVKILGRGEIGSPVEVHAHKFSE